MRTNGLVRLLLAGRIGLFRVALRGMSTVKGPPIYSVPTTLPRDGRRRRLVDGRAPANRMPCHPSVSKGKSLKTNISTRPLFQESWSGNSGRSGTVVFLPVDQRLPPAQHSRRIRDGSRHTPAPPLRVADETRHLANVPLIMLLRVSTHSADGSGWMGGRLQKLTEFSERVAKTLSWQKLQKDITADVVDWWFGVSVGHEKRRRGVSG
ncbi:hypothetical protein B0T18DRAFT_190245 [Schizothecium vesticola]|uniref:Uncharacterized protein n=1 Tax=Schizothecium vesticola TaxID=314040 RepID=A0AA40EQP1_9PEZI|nr:hypothetical protein B0T18DRAFT_190245 [Schizothecium vesticola]